MKISLDEIHTFQGRSMRIRIIKQKEQREIRGRNIEQHQEGH